MLLSRALRRQIAEYSTGTAIRGRTIEFSGWKYYREIRHLYATLCCAPYIATTLNTPLAYPKSFTHYHYCYYYRVICRLQRNSRDQPEVIAL